MPSYIQPFLNRWRMRARELKKEAFALYFAFRDPRMPWYAKIFAALVVAYAFSPLDLIPDPIPVLGYLDDLLLVPLGIVLALKMIPPEVIADSRLKVQERIAQDKPVSRLGVALVITVWCLIAVLLICWVLRMLSSFKLTG